MEDEAVTGEIEQLVLPQRCRTTVLRLAHSIPLAGHLGRKKMAERVKMSSYWPTLFKDVANYCRSAGRAHQAVESRFHW